MAGLVRVIHHQTLPDRRRSLYGRLGVLPIEYLLRVLVSQLDDDDRGQISLVDVQHLVEVVLAKVEYLLARNRLQAQDLLKVLYLLHARLVLALDFAV